MTDEHCLEECWTRAEGELAFALPVQAAFQEWVELLGEDQAIVKAEGFVFVDEVDIPINGEAYTREELEQLRHFALVGSVTDVPYTLEHNLAYVDPSGVQYIQLHRLIREIDRSTPAKAKAALTRTKFLVGRIMCQLIYYFDVYHNEPGSGRLTIRSIDVVEGPVRTKEEQVPTEGMWHKVALAVYWGYGGK